MVRKKCFSTRGLRNKNPFNIVRSSQPWKGKVPHYGSTDSKFEQFYSLEYGLRAGLLLLRNYIVCFGYTTPRNILCRFAPSSENNLVNYNFFVSTYVRLDIEIKPFDNNFYKLARAILDYESSYIPENGFLESIVKLFKLDLV